ncbi:nif-specific transcriptional activator NifA [Anaeromyxobacter paludicola]|uniref:Nif-specific regulatory protein n=1 Tax=Anaeromyxobacter paludicola TaxID=2918171 RepID=A0ABN6NC55_9BACT|nr:nif-specific transcriptional activator NifA [Anaeromyxobacter paludicola]BDG10839.1 sigma-54-dependent Fis family transcriptional regulator [Anaeromyxobacter paludicola]
MEPRRADLELEALGEIASTLSYTSDLNKGLTSTLTILRLLLGMENGTVSLFDPVTGEVFIEAAPEMSDAERILGRLRPGEGIIGRTFQTGMPAVVPDVAEEPLFLDRTGTWRNFPERRALLAVPIRDGRSTLGVLTVDRPHRQGPPRYDRDMKLLGIVSALVGARVRLAQHESPRQREAPDEAPALAAAPALERFPGVIGKSRRMRDLMELVARVAPSRATVFLRGESGTGKEVLARALHDASPRAARPFVAVNCAAISEPLFESELFGHEKGAFTGAAAGRAGRFELADGGTLFLDEVGEIPLASQVKLLRALQERQFERVGGSRTVTVDVRIVAATNRDLEEAVRAGAFRLDLYHRLSVVTLDLPPLRERKEDVPELARHFLAALNAENGRRCELAPEAVAALCACRWTGNVRQLRNCLERAVVSSPGERIAAADLCFELTGGCRLEEVAGGVARAAAAVPAPSAPGPVAPGPSGEGDAAERARVVQALTRCGFVQAKAARQLGMTVRQLRYRVQKYGIALEQL